MTAAKALGELGDLSKTLKKYFADLFCCNRIKDSFSSIPFYSPAP